MTSQSELIPTMPGDILRYEREKQGLTVDRAAELSRIKPSVLQAIEDGETSRIPEVYLRGYIRNYAHYLGVDVAHLDEHMVNVQSSDTEVRSIFEVPPKPPGSERWLKASSYLVASALIATLAWQFTHEAVRFSQGDSRLTSGTAIESEAGRNAGVEESSNAAPSKRHLNASIASIEMMNTDSRDQEKNSEALWTPVEEIALDVSGSESVESALRVITSADTWVEITDGDNQQLEMDLIRADESRQYNGTPPYRILIGRASSVRVQLDGQDVDLAAFTRGNVARMTLGKALLSRVTPEAEDDTP